MGLFQDAPALCRAPADGAPVLTPPTSTDPVHHAVRRTRVLASGLPRFDAGRFPARDTGQRSRGADGSLLLGFRGKVFLEAGVLPKKFFFFLLLSFLLRIQIGAEWTVAARQPPKRRLQINELCYCLDIITFPFRLCLLRTRQPLVMGKREEIRL